MTSLRLAGKKALVTGAYGGMGRAVAVALAREGVSCALLGRETERLAKVVNSCSESRVAMFPVVCDLSRTETIEKAVEEAIDALGGLNYLINCSGVYEIAAGDDGALEVWDRVMNVNLRATYHLARHALPEINKLAGGAIIKIGSIPSAYPGAGAFAATSRALDGYAEALFEDVREFGTKVCTIRPGFVNTPMVNSRTLDSSLMIQPEDIARTVVFVLGMPETACPTEITIRPQRSPYRQ